MENLNYLDFLVLVKIDQNSVIERFGPMINTSFFESANLLGSLKVKGFVDLETSIGGMSRVSLTELGRDAIEYCGMGTLEPLDTLDSAILDGIGRGYVALDRLTTLLNIKQSDLAVHLNKLSVQGFIVPSIQSAKVSMVLTEKGFNKAGNVKIAEGFSIPGQTKLTDNSAAAKHDISKPVQNVKPMEQEVRQPAPALKQDAKQPTNVPEPSSPKQATNFPDPADIAQDAKDILFGFFPKSAPKEQAKSVIAKEQAKPSTSSAPAMPKPAEMSKNQAEPANPNVSPAASMLDDSQAQASTLHTVGIKGVIMPEAVNAPPAMNPAGTPPAYPYVQPEEKKPENALKNPSLSDAGEKPVHHASKDEVKTARVLSKIEYYAAKSVNYIVIILALLAGFVIAYFIFMLLGFKAF